MPRPGEDRSDVGGAAQFNNIGPVPLSPGPVPLSLVLLPGESDRGMESLGIGQQTETQVAISYERREDRLSPA